MLYLSLHKIREAMEGVELAGDIVSAIFERSTFRNDYLQSNSERAKKQWFAKQEQIGKMLGSAARKKWSQKDELLVREIIGITSPWESCFH